MPANEPPSGAPAPDGARLRGRSAFAVADMVLAVAVGMLGGLGDGAAASAGQGLGLVLLAAFLVVDSHRAHGWKGTASFAALLYLSAFAFEALSIATGFPFGHFRHNGDGLQIFGVPPAVPVVYAVVGWTAWVLARRIIAGEQPLRGAGRVLVPLAAALLLAGYDAVIDPFGGTIGGGWTYADPGGLSGVPLTNFYGWTVTGFVGFQLFALIEDRLRRREPDDGRAWSMVPATLWLGLALPHLFPFAHDHSGTVVAGESTLAIADIHEAPAIVALFTMVLPAVVSIARAMHGHRAARGSRQDEGTSTAPAHDDRARPGGGGPRQTRRNP